MITRYFFEVKELISSSKIKIEIIRVSVKQLTVLKLPSRITAVWIAETILHFNSSAVQQRSNGHFLNDLIYALLFSLSVVSYVLLSFGKNLALIIVLLTLLLRISCHVVTSVKYYCFKRLFVLNLYNSSIINFNTFLWSQ
jgi:hypothetical protein